MDGVVKPYIVVAPKILNIGESITIQSRCSEFEPQTNPQRGCGSIDVAPCGNEIFVGVEVRAEGQEDSRTKVWNIRFRF
jgi:hypothetical protein